MACANPGCSRPSPRCRRRRRLGPRRAPRGPGKSAHRPNRSFKARNPRATTAWAASTVGAWLPMGSEGGVELDRVGDGRRPSATPAPVSLPARSHSAFSNGHGRPSRNATLSRTAVCRARSSGVGSDEEMFVVDQTAHRIARLRTLGTRVVVHPHDGDRKRPPRLGIPRRRERRVEHESMVADDDRLDHGGQAPITVRATVSMSPASIGRALF
jgi:hypothetical protein